MLLGKLRCKIFDKIKKSCESIYEYVRFPNKFCCEIFTIKVMVKKPLFFKVECNSNFCVFSLVHKQKP